MSHPTTEPWIVPRRTPPPGKISYEEFLEWLDDETHAEWVAGEVVFMSPVSYGHSSLHVFLIQLFGLFLDVRRTGVLLGEPFHMKTGPGLPGRSPDILYLANEHLDRIKRSPDHLEGPADLIVEIISPDSRTRDRKHKYAEYERGGVREYWLLDPMRRQADFFQLGEDSRYVLVPPDENGLYRSAVIEGFWIKVDWLWQDPRPSLLAILREWGLGVGS